MLILHSTSSSHSASFFYPQLSWVTETYPKNFIGGPVSWFSHEISAWLFYQNLRLVKYTFNLFQSGGIELIFLGMCLK